MFNPINADATSVISNEEKQYDFSQLNKFLNDVLFPVELVDFLNEVRVNYLELFFGCYLKKGKWISNSWQRMSFTIPITSGLLLKSLKSWKMETTVKIFKNEHFGELRVTEVNGETMFVANDVASSLGYSKPANAITDHCKGVTILMTPSNKGIQKTKFIPESDVYRLIMRSKLPEAESFQEWVTGEVLPSIRKSGGYMMTLQEDTPEMIMARALLVAQSTIERHKEQYQLAKATIMEQAPKVEYFNDVLQSEALIPVNVIAKELGMTSVKLNKKLHALGVIYKSGETWVLYEKHQDKGYTRTKTIPYIDSLGNNKTAIHTYWTESGRLFIHNIMKGGLI